MVCFTTLLLTNGCWSTWRPIYYAFFWLNLGSRKCRRKQNLLITTLHTTFKIWHPTPYNIKVTIYNNNNSALFALHPKLGTVHWSLYIICFTHIVNNPWLFSQLLDNTKSLTDILAIQRSDHWLIRALESMYIFESTGLKDMQEKNC